MHNMSATVDHPRQMLRELDSNDVSEIARIHRLAFPESAWTKLGGTIVEEYYLWHLLGPHPIVRATGAFVDGNCSGFCVSGIFQASTSGFLSKNKNLLMKRLALKPWLVIDPVFFDKAKSGVNILRRFKKRNRGIQSPAPPIDSFGILSLAVDPESHGLGIGQLLMSDAEKSAIDQNYSKMDLTVNPGNRSAIRFYKKQGWVKVYQNDIWKGVMIKQLEPRAK
jgi:ribosomal protein S18 acetylase RimI-like enzyme